MSQALTKTIEVIPGWDRREQDKGFHGCEVLFILRGQAGVLTFASGTDWSPMSVQQKHMNGAQRTNIVGVQPVAMDFVYHSFRPSSLPEKNRHNNCPYATDGICYTHISHDVAVYLRDVLLKEGSDGVWRELRQRYRSAAGITQTATVRKK